VDVETVIAVLQNMMAELDRDFDLEVNWLFEGLSGLITWCAIYM
jgi:hypothetical protein